MIDVYRTVVLLSPVIMVVFWGSTVFAYGIRSQKVVVMELATSIICVLWLALISQLFPNIEESASFSIYTTGLIAAMSAWASARRVLNMLTYVSVKDDFARGLVDTITKLEAEIEALRAGEIVTIINGRNNIYQMPSASAALLQFDRMNPVNGDIVFAKDESTAYLVRKHIELQKLVPGVITDIVHEKYVHK